jgi:hypothetical protein
MYTLGRLIGGTESVAVIERAVQQLRLELQLSFMIFLDHLFLIIRNIQLSVPHHSPVNFSNGSMENFFTYAHFTFMNGSDGELKEQSPEN